MIFIEYYYVIFTITISFIMYYFYKNLKKMADEAIISVLPLNTVNISNKPQDRLCSVCNSKNFSYIPKPLSAKDKAHDQEIGFLICKTCDPLTASLSLLSDGYQIYSEMYKKSGKEKI